MEDAPVELVVAPVLMEVTGPRLHMVVDAEAHKAELIAGNEGSGPLFKLSRDPRIARIGALLCRYQDDVVVAGALHGIGLSPHRVHRPGDRSRSLDLEVG